MTAQPQPRPRPQPQPVRSRTVHAHDHAALLRREQLRNYRGLMRRSLALALFGVSLAGALIWGGGGLDAWWAWTPNPMGIAVAVAIQAVATGVQWVFGGNDWWNPLYLGAVGASSATSILGYWPLAHPWATALLVGVAGESMVGYYSPWIVGAAIIAALIAADVLPERVLISE
jgi:hypothetical protein